MNHRFIFNDENARLRFPAKYLDQLIFLCIVIRFSLFVLVF